MDAFHRQDFMHKTKVPLPEGLVAGAGVCECSRMREEGLPESEQFAPIQRAGRSSKHMNSFHQPQAPGIPSAQHTYSGRQSLPFHGAAAELIATDDADIWISFGNI